MTGFIYPVIVAWTWGGGWLTEWGYYDFAGSGVVHMTGGVSGLAGAIICGARIGKFTEEEETKKPTVQDNGFEQVHQRYKAGEWDILRVHEFVRLYTQKLGDGNFAAHSPQQVVLGTLILWLGWLMFNGGSSLAIVGAAGASAQIAIVNTILAPSAAGVCTFVIKNKVSGQNLDVRYDFSGLTNGILAGLVAITASCDSVEPWAAIIIGILGSFLYCLTVRFANWAKIDDPLEAFHVHGACGFLGVLCYAIFAKDVGIIYGGEGAWGQLGKQAVGALAITLWSGIVSSIFYIIAKKTNTLRLS